MAGYFRALKSAVTGSEATPYEVLAKHEHFEERSYPAMKWVCVKRKGRARSEVQKDLFMTLFAYINGKNEANAKIDMTAPVSMSYVLCAEEEAEVRKDAEKPAENGDSEKPAENGDKDDAGTEEKEENGEEDKKAAVNGKDKDGKKKSSKDKSLTLPLKEYTMGFYVPKSHQETPPKPSDPDVFIEDRPAMTVVARTFGGYAKDAQWETERENLLEEIKKTPGTLEVDSGNFFTAGYDPPFKPLFRRNEVWLIKTGGEVLVPVPVKEEPEKKEEEKKEAGENGKDEKKAEEEKKNDAGKKEEEEVKLAE